MRYKGKIIGTVRKFSDKLLVALLEVLRPEKYRPDVKAKRCVRRDPDREVMNC